MSRELNLGALPIARNEYLSQLVSFLQPLISKGFWAIYQDARKKCSKEDRRHERFKEFQYFVKQIPLWSSLIIEDETRRIKEKVECLSELITVIFVGNVKILASIRLKGETKNIKVKVPSCNNFIHTVYINTARKIYYNPLLFDHTCETIQNNKNMEIVYEYIESSIVESIQQMLPLKSILDEYLGNAFDNEENDDSDSEGSYLNEVESVKSDKSKKILDFGNKPPVIESGYMEEISENSENENSENENNDDISEEISEVSENSENENSENENNDDISEEISEISENSENENNDETPDFPLEVGPSTNLEKNKNSFEFGINREKFKENPNRDMYKHHSFFKK